MRLYVEVARRTYARISTYRGATVAGVFTNTVFGFLFAYVLLAVYQQRPSVGGFDAADAVTFTFVAQGLLMPLGIFGGTEIADRITTGDVIVDLQRPYDHQAWWAAVDYGKAGYYLLFRGIPPFLAGALVFDLQLPGLVPRRSRSSSASAFAIAVAFAWRYLLQLSAFWLLDVRGPNQLGWLVGPVPLRGRSCRIVFFPAWLETRCRVLPFASMLQVPIEIWLGRHRGADLLAVWVRPQVAWLAAPRAARAPRARAAPCAGWWCRVAEARRLARGVAAAGRGAHPGRLAVPHVVRPLPAQPRRSSPRSTSRSSPSSSPRSTRWRAGRACEVALLFGLAGVAFGLADLLVSQVELASTHLKAGTFDLFLLRPMSTLLQLSASEFALRRLGRVIQPLGGARASPSCSRRSHWTPEAVLLVPVTVVSGTVIFGSVWVVTSSMSFWTVESQELGNAFTYGGGLAAQYPIDVLGTWLRRLFTFLVPLAFVAYLPAARLLGRAEPLGLPSAVGVGHAARGRGSAPWPPAPSGAPPSATTRAPGADRAERSDHRRPRPRQDVRRAPHGRAASGVGATDVEAVSDVDLRIERGAMVGYIGPNGAGKSTTIKMLTGILVPTAGHVRVDGLEPSRQRTELAGRIGVVFGQRSQLWWDLPLRDSFELLRHVYRVPAARHAANLARFTAALDLGPLLDVPVRQLSLGQRMRGELTAALLHDPSILLLDEPTIGLDVVSKEAVREFLVEINQEQGTTVLLTTHDLTDVERLCERLLIIDHGRVIEDSTVAGITQRYGTERTLVVDLVVAAPPLHRRRRRGHPRRRARASGCGSSATR